MLKRNSRLLKLRQAVDFERSKRLKGYNCHMQMSTECKVNQWKIAKYISLLEPVFKYSVVILNRPIEHNQEFLLKLWKNAAVTLTIDGGTKRWDTFLSQLTDDLKDGIKPPDLVTGDFDSITTELMTKYKVEGSQIIYTPDQNATDFTKALGELHKYCEKQNIQLDATIVITQNSGRIDQLMGNVQTLFLNRTKKILPAHNHLYLVAEDSLSWLLYEGEHCIEIPECVFEDKKPWCSLVPVGEECFSVTTKGLKWDLDNQSLKFGKIVSTSNSFNGSPMVTIKNSNPLLWSLKLPSLSRTYKMEEDTQR